MKQSSYREQDYAFGQLMLTLRMGIGLTQAGLAEFLGVSRNAVGDWETGQSYPKAEHLKAFIALALQQQVFEAGREEEEIRALWHTAHQKVLLDEPWLQGLLAKSPSAQVTAKFAQAREAEAVSTPPAGHGSRTRDGHLGRVGGAGALPSGERAGDGRHRQVSAGHQGHAPGGPTCEALLDDFLQVLAPEVPSDMPVSLERRFSLLLECVRRTRVLLVLDNLETLLEEGQSTGRLRPGYEGYTRLLRQMAETEHQSCLLLTSREKPRDLVPLEGSREPVRILRLARLEAGACQQLLAEKEISGSAADQARLIEAYAGNPLALNIIAQTIVDLFDGEIAPFLEQGEVVFGGVRELLDEQYARLANLEQLVLHWLAIVREPVNLGKLRAVMPGPSGELLEAVDRLRQRSLIEHGHHPGSFTLQSLVLEYVTMRLGGERQDRASMACAQSPAWTLPSSRQGVYTTDPGAVAAGSRAGMFSAYLPGVRSGGRAVTLAARPGA